MKIKVKFVSFLRELSGVDKAELCLPQDATVKDALEKVVYDFPKLKNGYRNIYGCLLMGTT